MTHSQYELLSNQAVAACAVVYFLAVLAHLAQWALARKVEAPVEAVVSVGAATGASAPPAAPDADDEDERIALFGRIGVALTVVAAFVQFIAIVSRGLAADPVRVPWGNMYEFTLVGTWVVVMGYLLLYKRFKLAWLAPIVTSFVLITLMIDVLVLYTPVVPLRDALQSPWLVIHVVAAIIATGAFTLGGMCSALYLVKSRWEEKQTGTERSGGYLAKVPTSRRIDLITYRFHAFAFPLWTFAVAAGAIWAEYAWGRYWGWDPKETWALVTWVVFACYLHARSTAGWRGTRAAVIALIGVASFWFNFVGINLLVSGLHSYAGI